MVSSSDDKPENGLDFETMKLAFEKEKFRDTYKLDRFKIIWISGVVALITAIITAGAGISVSIISAHTKEQELTLQEFKQNHEYLSQFVEHALHKDLQRRIDFAHYVANVALTKPVASVWRSYHQKMEEEYSDSRTDLRAKVQRLQGLKSKNDTKNSADRTRLQEEIRALQRRIFGDVSDVKALKKLNSILGDLRKRHKENEKVVRIIDSIGIRMGLFANDLTVQEQIDKQKFRESLDKDGCFVNADGEKECDKAYFEDGCFRFNDGETHCDNY